MWQERIGRLLMVGIGTMVVILLVRSLSNRPEILASLGKMANLSQIINQKQESDGILSKILGQSAKEEIKPDDLVSRVDQEGKDLVEVDESSDIEPIEQPVENVRHQSQILLDLIKKLPEEQLEAVKKQLCKELCGE